MTTLLALVVLWQFRTVRRLRPDLAYACGSGAPIG
jgi:hypothetical protein